MIQDRTYLKESLGLCDFNWPITYSENIPGLVGDPDLMNKVFAAVTGLPGAELERYAARIFNLQRAILLREGRRVPGADYPPEYNFTEPLQAALNFGITEVPGPGEEVVGVMGNMLDRDRFTDMLREYYRLRGWDEGTGKPLPATLAALGMEDVAV
jgi:aldehyde:ferredoxin oxidoreductase